MNIAVKTPIAATKIPKESPLLLPDLRTTPKPAPLAPEALDRRLHVWQSNFTGGWSPSTVGMACLDWAVHAANRPFEMLAMAGEALKLVQRLSEAAVKKEKIITPPSYDRRFAEAAWQRPPYDLLVQAVLLGEEWAMNLVKNPGGVSKASERIVSYCVRQMLDLMSPSNNPWLNPEVIEAARAMGGANFVEGLQNFLADLAAEQGPVAESGFRVGGNLAVTPGKVVFRNALMELIQYMPTTPTVEAEPVLIVPAWIMKYYILDLSPRNSLVRWLVAQGRTVFMISWRNPVADMKDTSLDDYRDQGVRAAVEVVRGICGDRKIHAAGYCLGGTLLSIAATAMAIHKKDYFTTLTLLAAQTDYSEAGELQLFISEDQLDFLNDLMETQGGLSSVQMSSAFKMLRTNNLVWSKIIHEYWIGKREPPNDLMAWDADGTRLPTRMHIEFLRGLYLNNDLAEGRFRVKGHQLVLGDISLPMFLVGTETDHVAPWHSVFKMHALNEEEMTFVLTSGGHNAGIVSEPGHPRRHYRIRTRPEGGPSLGPDEWEHDTPPKDGSWWPEWAAWLKQHSSGGLIEPPRVGSSKFSPLCDAPGTYVLEK